MCTAISYTTKDHYFGRNLDLEVSYGESVVITPRNFQLQFQNAPDMKSHYAIIGIGIVIEQYPLYYDATNEFGLSMAALNFPGNAVYLKRKANIDNITPYELIPWILGQCKTVADAREKLSKLNMLAVPFSKDCPLTPLHWIIADRTESITVEPREDGIKVYDNPAGVLTNNPPFDFHLNHLCNYLNLTHKEPANRFSDKITLAAYSRGMGAMGLPGDLSSSSRFIRAAFTKLNSVSGESESESVGQFFHILGSVYQQNGCVKVKDSYEKTVYSSCCNTDKGIYYYTTYENSQISAVSLFAEDLDGVSLVCYPMINEQQIFYHNK